MGTAAARRRAPRFLRRGAASRTVRKVSTNRWRRRAAAPPRRHAPCGRGCRRWRGRCGRRRRCSRRDGCSGGHPARRRSARRRLRRRRGAVPRGCGSGRASNSRTTASARCRPPAGCRWAAADRQKHDGQQPCDRYYGRLLLPQYGCRRGDCQQEICGEEKIHDQGRFLVRCILCAKKYLEIKKLLFIFV